MLTLPALGQTLDIVIRSHISSLCAPSISWFGWLFQATDPLGLRLISAQILASRSSPVESSSLPSLPLLPFSTKAAAALNWRCSTCSTRQQNNRQGPLPFSRITSMSFLLSFNAIQFLLGTYVILFCQYAVLLDISLSIATTVIHFFKCNTT